MKDTNKTTKNKIVIAIFFLSSIVWLNVLDASLTTHAVGIAFIIATAYGVVAMSKNSKFMF